jgi:hypothetical protein
MAIAHLETVASSHTIHIRAEEGVTVENAKEDAGSSVVEAGVVAEEEVAAETTVDTPIATKLQVEGLEGVTQVEEVVTVEGEALTEVVGARPHLRL